MNLQPQATAAFGAQRGALYSEPALHSRLCPQCRPRKATQPEARLTTTTTRATMLARHRNKPNPQLPQLRLLSLLFPTCHWAVAWAALPPLLPTSTALAAASGATMIHSKAQVT